MLCAVSGGGVVVVIFTALALVAWTAVVYWWAFGAGKACGLAEARRVRRMVGRCGP